MGKGGKKEVRRCEERGSANDAGPREQNGSECIYKSPYEDTGGHVSPAAPGGECPGVARAGRCSV